MGVKSKYIREAGFDIDVDFVETIKQIDIRTASQIAEYIVENIESVPYTTLTSDVLEGVIINDDNEPVTFIVEIIKEHPDKITLCDLQLISMNEYLDLLNLKLKSNGPVKSKSNKKHC
tara:strand:- start:88 stop:441 length:354 start_codon:yes stop_codon:yes gene_type:complete